MKSRLITLFVLLAVTVSGAPVKKSVDIASVLMCDLFAPDAPEFGQVVVKAEPSSENVATTATFSCTYGYSLKGTPSMNCSKGTWMGSVPTCELDAFEGTNGCNLSTWNGCRCLNDARNPIMWTTEMQTTFTNGTTSTLLLPTNTTLLRCRPEDRRCKNDDEPAQIKDSSDFIKTVGKGNRKFKRSLPLSKTTTRIRLDVTLNDAPLVAVVSTFEVGVFIRSPLTNYIHFIIFTEVTGVGYDIIATAHCLPDPAGTLVPLGADPFQHFRITESGSLPSRRNVCLNLKNVDRCSSNRFSVRLTVNLVVIATDPDVDRAGVTVIPASTSETLSRSCRKTKADNE